MLRQREAFLFVWFAVMGGAISASHSVADEPTRKEIKALVVNGAPDKKPAEQPVIFLDIALGTLGETPGPGGGKIRHRVVSPARFSEITAKELAGWDCIFLCDVPRLDKADARRLEAFVRGGGGVVVILGPRVDVKAYNTELYRDGKGLLPVKLLDRRKAESPNVLRFALAKSTPPLSRDLLRNAHFTESVRVEEPVAKRNVGTMLLFEEAHPDKEDKATAVGAAVLEWRPYSGPQKQDHPVSY